jgi:hypothetical protein
MEAKFAACIAGAGKGTPRQPRGSPVQPGKASRRVLPLMMRVSFSA